MDEGGGERRHTEERVDCYCLRTGVDDSGGVHRHTVKQVEGYYPCTGVDEGGVRRHTIRNYATCIAAVRGFLVDRYVCLLYTSPSPRD